jgi:hypothetical protein
MLATVNRPLPDFEGLCEAHEARAWRIVCFLKTTGAK